MRSDAVSDREAILAACDHLDAVFDTFLGRCIEGFTDAELLVLQDRLERNLRRAPALEQRILHRLTAQGCLAELGGTSWAQVLCTRLRISQDDAKRRIRHAQLLGPRRALNGEPLAPALPNTAAAQARGDIGAEHVRIIEKFFHQLPAAVDYQTRELAEADLAHAAADLGPTELRALAERLMALVNPDGEFSDADRARRRSFRIGPQQRDGMSKAEGWLTPEARAVLEPVMAKHGAPGMCNPDDESPCVDGEPTPEAVASDTRSTGQRNHDALVATGRAVLASGQLGSHNGLPVTMVITTTLQELESGRGHAVTGGGSLLPMTEVIRQAAGAHHYLAVFDKHTNEPLYLGRAKRLASKAQRIVLYAKDRGCTFPGCTAPAYHSQVHHAAQDWAAGGQTNITDETLACGKDNRRVKPGGYTTRKRKDGRTEWIPPPHLDTGQTRVNNYHHPERYLLPDDGDGDDESEE